MKITAKFPKSSRLLRKNDFSSLRENSFSIPSKGFRFICKITPESNSSRLGLAVSSQVGNAIKRNKIKRLVREEFRKTSFVKPFDFLFIPSKNIDVLNLSTNLKKFFEKSKEF